MSITDELRKFAWKECPSKFLERVTGIADRIDAAHEKMPDHWALEFLQLTDAAIDLRDRLEKAEDENAKLRELVRDMWGAYHDGATNKEFRALPDRMRELGVEVDE